MISWKIIKSSIVEQAELNGKYTNCYWRELVLRDYHYNTSCSWKEKICHKKSLFKFSILVRRQEVKILVQFGINKHMQTFSKTTNCKQILFASFEKIYPCLFIPNCTRNHVITYTKLEIRDRGKRKICWKDKHFDKLPTLTAVLLTERKSKLFVYN